MQELKENISTIFAEKVSALGLDVSVSGGGLEPMDYEYDSDRGSQREELFSALRLEDFLSSSGTPRYFLPGTLYTTSAFVVMRYLSTVIIKLVPIDSMKRKIKNSYCREHLSVPRYEILVRARSDLRHPAVRSVIVDTTKGSLEKSFLFALCHLDGHSSAVSRPSDLGIRIHLIMASVNGGPQNGDSSGHTGRFKDEVAIVKKSMDGAVSVVAETMKKTTLLSAVTWDVFSPPPSNSFKVSLSKKRVLFGQTCSQCGFSLSSREK